MVSGEVPEETPRNVLWCQTWVWLLQEQNTVVSSEERMKKILDEVVPWTRCDSWSMKLHTLYRRRWGRRLSHRCFNILKPALARWNPSHRATTLDEYQNISKRRSLRTSFCLCSASTNLSADDKVEILKGLRKRYEDHHRVEITDAKIEGPFNYRFVILRLVNYQIKPSTWWTKQRKSPSGLGSGKHLPLQNSKQKWQNFAQWRKIVDSWAKIRRSSSLTQERTSQTAACENYHKKAEAEAKRESAAAIMDEDIAEWYRNRTGIPLKQMEKRSERLVHLGKNCTNVWLDKR